MPSHTSCTLPAALVTGSSGGEHFIASRQVTLHLLIHRSSRTKRFFDMRKLRSLSQATQDHWCGYPNADIGVSNRSACQNPRMPDYHDPHHSAHLDHKAAFRLNAKLSASEKPFKCTFESCEKRFSTPGNMYRHRRIHACQQFVCPASGCTRVYFKFEKLTRHYKVHMGSAAYPCGAPGCTKSFATSGNLWRHVRRSHESLSSANSSSGQCSVESSTRVVQCAVDVGRVEYSGPISYIPITAPQLSSDGISDQDLLECLQCLFVDDLPVTSAYQFDEFNSQSSSYDHFNVYC